MLWSAWYDEVLPDCPGVPQTFASNCIRAAAIEFFRESRVWQETSDAINAVANQADYSFAKSGVTNVAVVDWLQVWWKGSEIDAYSKTDLIGQFQNWPTQTGQPEGFTSIVPDKLTLVGYPTANETGAIKATAILRPGRASTEITDARGEEYFEAIAYGAKNRIQRVPGKSYTDLSAAASNLSRFESEIARHNVASVFGKNRSRINSRTRFM
jgi:hypothetical protein